MHRFVIFVPVSAKYTYKNFSLQFIDLFFPGYPGLNQDYFDFNNSTTGHAAELGLSFNGTETIPFSIYSGVIVYGSAIDPKANTINELNRSVYVEINYMGSFNNLNYNIFAGMTPTSSILYGTKGFSVFNLGISAKKNIQITDQFALPFKLTLAGNTPNRQLYLVAAVSL